MEFLRPLMNFLAIDFEYKDTNEARLTLVSVALSDGETTKSIWLHEDDEKKAKLKKYLLGIRATHTLLCFNYNAEGISLISLGLNPILFKTIDIQCEWKHLTNHHDNLGYGQNFFEGRIKVTSRKSYFDEDDKLSHDRTPTNLLAATYKLLGGVTKADYDRKNEMRDLILGTEDYSVQNIKDILAYGAGDVKDLFLTLLKMDTYYEQLMPAAEFENLREHQLKRGETVARAAVIASIGYPVNREKVTNFAANVPKIIEELHEDINSQFPDTPPFRWNKKENRYSTHQKVIKDWIGSSDYCTTWERTKTNDYSLSLDAFEKFFSWRHDFPRNNFPAQFLRWLKTNQSLNGFRPKGPNAKNKATFFSYYGSDDRAHPYLNAYGSQSARYQPKALGFLHLKSAWMRSLVEPAPGRMICGIDYGSEEFLIGALLANDQAMVDAYASGDVYLYFAKLVGAVPKDGTKKEYKKERDAFKATVLAMQYLMGPKSLARKLTADTGEEYTYNDAKALIADYNETFPDSAEWKVDILDEYLVNGHLKLPDNWYIWGDNDNDRSVTNFLTQGYGSSILRKAIELAQDAGLTIILPLHDAAYCEFDSGDLAAVDTLADCMREAFAFYFKGKAKEDAFNLIRLDIDVWGPDCVEGEITTPGGLKAKSQKMYIDPRSEQEYEKFKQYLS